jgi:hypothetical protein
VTARRARASRWARLVTVAVVSGVGISIIVLAIVDWHLRDMEVYEAAAWRLRDGQALYGGEVDELSAYRYAPWFAYAWVPLTYLPAPVVRVAWSSLMLASTALAVWPLLRRGGVPAALLFGSILIGISAIGNVHPAMMALLMWGLPRRWGGIAVGVAASLKLVPILLVLHFVAERRWRQAVATVVVAAALWLPVLAYEIAPVSFDSGAARVLDTWAWLTVGGAAAFAATWLALRQSRMSTLAAGTAAVLMLPRLFVYEVSLVMVGAIPPRRRDRPGVADAAP